MLVTKTLSCKHTANIKCSQDESSVLCSQQGIQLNVCNTKFQSLLRYVVDILYKLHAAVSPPVWQLISLWNATLKVTIFVDILKYVVEKKLPCTHISVAECGIDPSEIKCSTVVDFKCQFGHDSKIKCFEQENYLCAVQVEIPLPCGHSVKIPIFAQVLYF